MLWVWFVAWIVIASAMACVCHVLDWDYQMFDDCPFWALVFMGMFWPVTAVPVIGWILTQMYIIKKNGGK